MNVRIISTLALVAISGQTLLWAGLPPDELARVRYDQHIGQVLSANLTFQDEEKRQITLGDLFHGKPILLVPGYYHCPMLCTLINDGLIESLQELRLEVGKDFEVVNVSIDPKETPAMAAAKRKEYLKRYGRRGADIGWHCLTTDKQTIAQLTNQAGFRFQYDPASHEYAHPSGFLVLTPQGKISRYFLGVNFDPKELRAALVTAGKGEDGSVVRQLALLCYHYNPITGKYGSFVLQIVRGFSIVTLLLLGGWIGLNGRRPARSGLSNVSDGF